MAELPSANVSISSAAGAIAAGLNYLTVIAAVSLNADAVPRAFTSAQSLLDMHGYAEGVDYAAMHFDETKKPILFVGVPIATAGTVGRENTTGNTGTCVTTLAPGADGTLDETDGQLRVVTGGTIGTDQIALELSLDGGRTWKKVRLGTANSYTIPRLGLTVNFAAGTLIADDIIHTWHTSAPLWDDAGIAAARAGLAASQKASRSWLVIGDCSVEANAISVLDEVNAYETTNQRFTRARVQVRDRLPYAAMSRVRVRMTGNPNLTFAEVGATGDTITRSAGSWISDGFAVGDIITVTGSASNNFTSAAKITAVSATVITLDTDDLTNEGPVSNVTVTGTPSLVFAEVGATGDTITRNRGSWIADGFRVGDKLTITGTVSNNIVAVVGITAVTATVVTFDTTDLVAEVIGSYGVTITAGETKAAHVAAMDAEFADIDDEHRIDIGLGRGAKESKLLTLGTASGFMLRRPVQWAASLREYQHDVHIPCWQKAHGKLDGWDLEDADGNLVEFDERADGGALAARFTCFRTYANGPEGPFIALSLTRGLENSLLSRTHNLDVANIACSVCQAETENAIGEVLVLNEDGTGTDASLAEIEQRVNSALAKALTSKGKEGQRASQVSWAASRTDALNTPSAELTGVIDLVLNGTLEKITTTVRVR